MAVTRILVADGLPLLADALAIALNLQPGFEVLDERPIEGPRAVDLAVSERPEVALVDYWMPVVNGLSVTETILAQVPKCRILLTTWLTAPVDVARAAEAGARGLVPKTATVAQVAEAIRQTLAGSGPYYSPQIEAQLRARLEYSRRVQERFQKLTPREIHVLVQLNAGASIAEIAKALGIRPKTVRNHISQILAKTGTRSQVEVVAKARESGFLA